MKSLLPLQNNCFGFMGTLLDSDYTENQINKLYPQLAKDMMENWGPKDTAQICLVFDSKFGRWMADSIIGMNKKPSEVITDVFRTKNNLLN